VMLAAWLAVLMAHLRAELTVDQMVVKKEPHLVAMTADK
jgi:hypothetical protein